MSKKRKKIKSNGTGAAIVAHPQVATIDEVPTTQTPVTFAFTVIYVPHQGMGLWQAIILKIQADQILDRFEMGGPDVKANALAAIQRAAYQIYFEDRLPVGAFQDD